MMIFDRLIDPFFGTWSGIPSSLSEYIKIVLVKFFITGSVMLRDFENQNKIIKYSTHTHTRTVVLINET